MPKSKRAKVVHLSKTEKKGKEHTLKLFAAVQTALDTYQYSYVFAVENMRNTYLKDIRTHFTESGGRLFFGKTKVMAKALGHSLEDEHLPGSHKLSNYVNGEVGLLFTDQRPENVARYFDEYSQVDFARAGAIATRTFMIPEGIVYSRGGEIPKEEDEMLPHSMEPSLRRWGMPTRLDKGKVLLDGDYNVCVEGQELNSHQTALLKMFGATMAEFRVMLRAWYDKDTEGVQEVGAMQD